MDGFQPRPASRSERLVGRDRDLAALRTFLRDAAHRGGALLVTGDPGIGKSALLDVAAAEAAATGTMVLRCTGLEFLGELSFATLNQLLMPLRGELDGLDPAHRDALSVAVGLHTQGTGDRLVVYNAALALLRRAATDRPLLLVVDDLQWVDRASAALLGFAARRLTGTRVGLLAALRPGTETFPAPAEVPHHALAALSDADAAVLLGARFPMLTARTARRLLVEAQGNPLALLELPTALSPAQREARRALPTILPLGRRLHAVFGARVRQLPPSTRRLLLLAALEGGDLGAVLRAADGHAGLADLEPAERAQLIAVDNDGRRLTFRHPLVRSTVVAVAAADDLAAAHRVLAAALPEPERQVWHLAESTTEPDEQVAGRLAQTARVVRGRGDAAGAFTALLRAADLTPDGGLRSRRLAEAAYLAADVTGELRTAALLLVEARRLDPELRGSLRAGVAAAYLLLNGDGDVDTAHRLLTAAIRSTGPARGADGQVLVEALHTLLDVCLYGARAQLWPAFHEAMGRLRDDPPPDLHLLTVVLAGFAELTDADLARLASAVEDLGTQSDPTRIERIATAALFLDRATGCRAALWRIVEDGRAGGAVTSAINALMVLCVDDFMTGQWDESAALAAEGLRLCAASGYRLLSWPFRYGQALVAAARGDDAAVRAHVRDMDDWATPRRAGAVHLYARHASGLAALGRGHADLAFTELSVLSPAGSLPFGVPNALWVGMDLVDAAVRSNRLAEARAHVAALQRARLGALSPHLALLAAAAAAVATAGGDGCNGSGGSGAGDSGGAAAGGDNAGDLFRQALAVPGADRWPFDFARVQLAYGEQLRRDRDAAGARAQLAGALATFQRLGAAPWAARAAEALRAAGESAQVGAPDGAPAAALTAQERQIAQLAASGLTNRQIGERLFLSHRTVGSHLHRIFPRLGITSRAALRDALSGLPAEPADRG